MTMKRPLLEATVTAQQCLYKTALHEYLQEALELPEYYGRNLSALADCLAESSRPTLITIAIDANELPTAMQAYIIRFTQVCAREALVNENVSVIIEHTPPAQRRETPNALCERERSTGDS